MSAPVDVLAVIDNFIDPQSAPHQPHDLREARAAVAELIDSQKADARLVAVLLSYLNDNLSEREKGRLGTELMARDLSDHAARRAAALARVGGAS